MLNLEVVSAPIIHCIKILLFVEGKPEEDYPKMWAKLVSFNITICILLQF